MTENRKTQTDELIEKLQRMVDTMPDETSDNTLNEQSAVLNGMFKRLISDCESRHYSPLHRYNLALRAQAQFVRTLDVMKKLERLEADIEETDDNED